MVTLEEPDKGYAWVVAISSFFINFILVGMSRTIGILYLQILTFYNAQRREAMLPFAVRTSAQCLSGPFVGIVGHKYGVRNVTFWGGLIAALGAALCRVAPDTAWLTVFWGGIHGIGFALSITLFRVVVNQHFEKYRTTASGIALSGSCVGSLTFPFIVESILNSYSLSGTFLMLGGILMHIMPFSLFLTVPLWVENPEKYKKLKKKITMAESETLHLSPASEMIASIMHRHKTSIVPGLSINPLIQLQHLAFSKSMLLQQRSKSLESGQALELQESEDDHRVRENRSFTALTEEQLSKDFSSATLNSLNTLVKESGISSTSDIQEETVNLGEEDNILSDSKKRKEKAFSIMEDLKIMILLYKNPMYDIICVGMTTYTVTYITIISILVDYGIDKGFPGFYGAYLIISISLGDLIGRLCFGWVTDKKFLSASTFMVYLFCLQGISLILFPITTTLFLYMTVLFFLGIALGNIMVLFSILFYTYVPTDMQILAIGGAGLLTGILSLSIPSMIGHFRDDHGSYDKMFYLLGGIAFFTAVLNFFVPMMMHLCYSESDLVELFGDKSESE